MTDRSQIYSRLATRNYKYTRYGILVIRLMTRTVIIGGNSSDYRRITAPPTPV
ncbi:hypothetical protein CBOM_01959 [Ceraceosorus bombacis]|uniref:Uncharacterized protein n=1 Tax=Ceraceosorus bombacis TaxID=401625 RepID=A0A0N7L9L0_9BASI|nr:hypothetical protein CBOM_01959 [Ceraceosorus bombacis]